MILWQRSCHRKWNMKKRRKEFENDKEEEENEDSEWETLWYFGDSICVTALPRSHCLRLLHHSYKPLTKSRSSHCDASCRIVKFFQLFQFFVVVVDIEVSEAIFEWFVTQGSCLCRLLEIVIIVNFDFTAKLNSWRFVFFLFLSDVLQCVSSNLSTLILQRISIVSVFSRVTSSSTSGSCRLLPVRLHCNVLFTTVEVFTTEL